MMKAVATMCECHDLCAQDASAMGEENNLCMPSAIKCN
jgi:hypothetical protein